MRHALAALLAALLLAPSGAAATPLVAYDRAGGFTGTPLTVSVSRAGVVRYVAGTGGARERYSLPRPRLAGLRRTLRRARFGRLRADYRPPPGTVADGFTHTVTYRGRTVRSGDGGSAPPRLDRLIGVLAGLADLSQ